MKRGADNNVISRLTTEWETSKDVYDEWMSSKTQAEEAQNVALKEAEEMMRKAKETYYEEMAKAKARFEARIGRMTTYNERPDYVGWALSVILAGGIVADQDDSPGLGVLRAEHYWEVRGVLGDTWTDDMCQEFVDSIKQLGIIAKSDTFSRQVDVTRGGYKMRDVEDAKFLDTFDISDYDWCGKPVTFHPMMDFDIIWERQLDNAEESGTVEVDIRLLGLPSAFRHK